MISVSPSERLTWTTTSGSRRLPLGQVGEHLAFDELRGRKVQRRGDLRKEEPDETLEERP
jgi:hypothetical protein